MATSRCAAHLIVPQINLDRGDVPVYCNRMPKLTVTERGWPGHYICAKYCLFRRNTLVSYGRRHIVVSTVGRRFDDTPVGCARHYETMAFEARRDPDGYLDADVSKPFKFPGAWTITEVTAQADEQANRMHERIVRAVAKLLQNPWCR